MNLHIDGDSELAAIARRCMIALCFCIVFASGASAATTSGVPAAADASAATGDGDQRNRQFQHAEALYLSGRLKDAAAAFADLVRLFPRDARIWMKYGNTLTRLRSYDEAATAFQTAVTLDPALGAPALNLALVRLAQAQASLELAVARLAAESPEHRQAEALQRELNTLLGAPDGGASPH